MKSWLLLLVLPVLVLTGCSKQVDAPITNIDPNEWMQTHESGRVAYVDHFSGNYIVETQRGYTVVESWGYTPRNFDLVYAHFSFRGVQTIYNRSGNYFTQGRMVDSWLSWFDAMYILEQLNNNPFKRPQ